ncbi:cysteine-rich venom protein Mr30-like isoform X1 [Mizuhopecten yessoensis]|uniref:cysteine-rich venom protein Mr30-like isoform X1 n=1 Tax=Mizuhopecten yessoensis TaxID=6573 RepID=UPI000B45DB03|nr:cysteine-rich venom protein Mr30-like isoform X1 [Mizuhopecten yessoensis]
MELFGVEIRIVFRILLFSFLVQVSVSSNVGKTNPYRRFKRNANCDAKFHHISSHTACISASGSATSTGVSASDQTSILNSHNTFRSNVSPTATNMRTMSWDVEVAMIAQKWAESCQLSHDDGYSRYIPGRFSVGQNLAMGHASWTVAITAWHDEVSAFTLGGTNVFSDVGHYTQMVWAETSKLGCGFAVCSGTNFYVCNYSPTGNLDYNNPYISGSSCSACPSSCSNNQCDCSGKVCLNGASMDIDTCQCTCNKAYLVGSECALNCTGLTSDPFGCGSGAFIASNCPVYSNLPTDCPLMCQTCPHGDGTGGSGTQTSTSSTSTQPISTSSTSTQPTSTSSTNNQPISTSSTATTQSSSGTSQSNGDSTTDSNTASRSLCDVVVWLGACMLYFLV